MTRTFSETVAAGMKLIRDNPIPGLRCAQGAVPRVRCIRVARKVLRDELGAEPPVTLWSPVAEAMLLHLNYPEAV